MDLVREILLKGEADLKFDGHHFFGLMLLHWGLPVIPTERFFTMLYSLWKPDTWRAT